MSEQRSDRKTRRRFLADMLFLGGGLTAAAIFAKSQLLDVEPEPVLAGKVAAPKPDPAVSFTPAPVCTETPDAPAPICTKTPQAPIDKQPEIRGRMVMPEPTRKKPRPPARVEKPVRVVPSANIDPPPQYPTVRSTPPNSAPGKRAFPGGMIAPRHDLKKH